MNVQINGELRCIDSKTVMDLIRSLDLDPTRLAVELNRDIVTKRDYESTMLADGDRIEIVQFVGGG